MGVDWRAYRIYLTDRLEHTPIVQLASRRKTGFITQGQL